MYSSVNLRWALLTAHLECAGTCDADSLTCKIHKKEDNVHMLDTLIQSHVWVITGAKVTYEECQ